MTTQPQKKRTYNKKTTTIQNSQKINDNFKSLTFDELIEKAQYYKSQLQQIEDYIKEQVSKVINFPTTNNIKNNNIEPPFTQGYNTENNNFKSSNYTKGDIKFSGIGTSNSQSEIPNIPKHLEVLSEFKTAEQVIKPIEPTHEVYETIGDQEQRLLLDDINHLLGSKE